MRRRGRIADGEGGRFGRGELDEERGEVFSTRAWFGVLLLRGRSRIARCFGSTI